MALSDHIEKKDVIQDGDYEPNRRGKPLTASTRMDLERIVKPIRTRRSGEPSSLKIIARNVPTSQATRNNHATSIEYSYETRLVISNLHYDVTREDLQVRHHYMNRPRQKGATYPPSPHKVVNFLP